MVSGSVIVAIKAVDEASSAFGKIQAGLGVLGGALRECGGGFSSVGNIISGFAGAGVLGAAAAGLGEVIKGLKWSVQEAVASQEAWNKLRFAVEQSGGSWAAAEAGVRSFATSLQETTRYSDEQTAVALQRLMGYGMDLDTAMRTVGSAMDLATAKDIDLTTASDLLGKAFAGNTSMLGRYGIIIKETETVSRSYKDILGDIKDGVAEGTISTESLASMMQTLGFNVFDSSGKMMTASEMIRMLSAGFADGQVNMAAFVGAVGQFGISTTEAKDKAATFSSVMDSVNSKFGGAAQADATTYAGLMDRFNNSMSELGEKIGTALLPGLTSMTEYFLQLSTTMGPLIDQMIAECGPALAETGAAFADLSAAIGGSGDLIKDILVALAGFIKVEVIGWAKIFEIVAKSIQGWVIAFQIIATALAPVGAAVGAFISQVSAAVSSFISTLTSVGQTIYAVFSAIQSFLTSVWSGIIGAISSFVGGIVSVISGGFSAVYGTISSIFNGIWGIVKSVLDAIVGWVNWAVGQIKGAFDWLKGVLTGGSIWPDMMREMQLQAKAGLGEVGRIFSTGLETSVLIPTAGAAATIPSAATPITTHYSQMPIEINITGVTDPKSVADEVERRLVHALTGQIVTVD